jgi:hypothetical protein
MHLNDSYCKQSNFPGILLQAATELDGKFLKLKLYRSWVQYMYIYIYIYFENMKDREVLYLTTLSVTKVIYCLW